MSGFSLVCDVADWSKVVLGCLCWAFVPVASCVLCCVLVFTVVHGCAFDAAVRGGPDLCLLL